VHPHRHSIVEVTTERRCNLALHRQLQAQVATAVHAAAALLLAPPSSPVRGVSSSSGSGSGGFGSALARQRLPLLPQLRLRPQLQVAGASLSSYSLELTMPLTSVDRQQQQQEEGRSAACDDNTGSSTGSGRVGSSSNSRMGSAFADPTLRHGFLLSIALAPTAAAAAAALPEQQQQQQVFRGVGEAAPLPGLHSEAPHEALAQLQSLVQLLQGVPVPHTVALLSASGLSAWLQQGVGLEPGVLLPSVRFALESALLQALAASCGLSLCELLQLQHQGRSPEHSSSSSSSSVSSSSSPPASGHQGTTSSDNAADARAAAPAAPAVQVNALLPGSGSVDEMVALAQRLVGQGHRALKIKVGRR
jgi:isochorismate synthase/2-succinyl-5-enolpyruvyl-6-hydroxy-3-cyclohexene-1-carboxylate synthase/2-succinyl-6-hydroxy-2,4-cyclohexadiene-1-carboxylate synthase/O-succinylbenzoate synthase